VLDGNVDLEGRFLGDFWGTRDFLARRGLRRGEGQIVNLFTIWRRFLREGIIARRSSGHKMEIIQENFAGPVTSRNTERVYDRGERGGDLGRDERKDESEIWGRV